MINTLLSEELLRIFFLEDGFYGDPASSLISPELKSTSVIQCKQNGFFCGEIIIKELCLFSEMDSYEIFKKDGEPIHPGDRIATVTGSVPSLLRLERILLNLIAFASGIATETRKYVDIIEPFGVRLLDTRKTLPGYRLVSKYAVKTGGGWNHRFSLSDLIMLKDNHVSLLGGVKQALTTLAESNRQAYIKTEIEVSDLKQALEALAFSPDIIMLDNFTPEEVKEAMFYLRGKAMIEVSGGIRLENISQYAESKPDFISTGKITQHIHPIDFNMKILL